MPNEEEEDTEKELSDGEYIAGMSTDEAKAAREGEEFGVWRERFTGRVKEEDDDESMADEEGVAKV